MAYDRLDSMEISGRYTSSVQGTVMGTFRTMPAPTDALADIVVQYLGEDTATMIKNHIYQCTLIGTEYVWNDVTPEVIRQYAQDRVLGTDGNGLITATEVTTDELDSLKNISGNVQDQIDSIITDTQLELDKKVDKYTDPDGNVYQLSQADFTIREKEKLASVGFGAQPNNIEEIQINHVTVPPQGKIVDLPVVEGVTYDIPHMDAGVGYEIQHGLTRPIFIVQIRDADGNVLAGELRITDTTITFTPVADKDDCKAFVIVGGYVI